MRQLRIWCDGRSGRSTAKGITDACSHAWACLREPDEEEAD